MAKYEDGYLSVPKLAKRADLAPQIIRDFLALETDPLPNLIVGSQPKILWSTFVEWAERNFGLNGTRRGTIDTRKGK